MYRTTVRYGTVCGLNVILKAAIRYVILQTQDNTTQRLLL
jgi:hypothetical protein